MMKVFFKKPRIGFSATSKSGSRCLEVLHRRGPSLCAMLLMTPIVVSSARGAATQEPKSKEEQKEEQKEQKKPDAFKALRLTQSLGLYLIGPVSPDKKSILLIAQKPNAAPNLYLMNLSDHSIRPPLTNLKWGVSDPQWSPDGQSIAFAGFNETGSFDEVFVFDLKTGGVRQLTKNAFSDKEPVFTPDGKRLLYTSDESPLPDAAFGILHVAAIPVTGGKPAGFTEDDCSSIHPGLSADGKSVLLVKVSDASGRHSLWQYSFDGKPQRDLTEEKFARMRKYITGAAGGLIVLWAQEQVEQQDGIYLLDPKSGQVRELPEPDLPKGSPALSPDGKLIAFVAPAKFGSQLYVYDSSTEQIKQLTFKPAATRSPIFVSNTEILFGSNRDGENELYLIDLSQPFEEKKKK
jgi:Tol biopolymer transport system component